jgi:arabinosaccharide transport system substrate-binding protein
MRYFPFGKAAFAMLLVAVLSGAWLGLHPPLRKTSTLTMWTFARQHYIAYQKAVPDFERAHPGVTVNVELVSNSALASRLQSAFQADLDVPDMCEIEISSAGTFFRGPLPHIGFADLTDRIHQSGLWDEMVQSRFAPYTSRGRIFGIPHDVHPVQLAYRRDLFEQLGLDADKLTTWDAFIAAGRKITVPASRYMIEFSDSATDNIEMCLFQRGGGYFDPQGNCIFDDETAVQTMLWYVPLVAGPKKIGNTLGGGQLLTRAMEDGYMLCFIAPDWRSKFFETDTPRVSGKMALMPLPAVTPRGRRTSTWGGTMLGITKRCAHQDLAWQFAMHLYLDKPKLAERFKSNNILPAMKAAWDQPAFHEPNPYFSNQPLGDTYARLAPSVPPQYSSPFVQTAKTKFGEALVMCVQRYEANGDKDFEPFVRRQLKQNADEVRTLIARNPYK